MTLAYSCPTCTKWHNSVQSGITGWKCQRLCCHIWNQDHYVTSADVSMFTQLVEVPFPRGGKRSAAIYWLYYSLGASTRQSRLCFWKDFKGSLPGRKWPAVRGAAAVTSYPYNHKAHLQSKPQLCHVTAQSRAEQSDLWKHKAWKTHGNSFSPEKVNSTGADTTVFFYNKKLAHSRFQNGGLGM